MRKKNPMKTIFRSNSPNRLGGYDYYKHTSLAKLYNYAPITHDAWVLMEACRQQMENIYGNKKDLPEDLRNLFEVDMRIIVEWLKSWSVANLHKCTCERAEDYTKPSCGKCMEGKTGWRLEDYVKFHMDDN